MFEKLQKPTYPELIIEQIKERILDQHLGPDDRLPSERELAVQFGVSRASIREATRALSTLGLVEARTGDGTYVSRNLVDAVLQPLSWAGSLAQGIERDLAEARKIIEPRLAALAAGRVTPYDRKILRETIDAMRTAVEDPDVAVEVATEEDLKFHMLIAEAAGNRILAEVMNGLRYLLRSLVGTHHMTHEDRMRCLQEHIEIYDAIEAGDAAGAQQAMLRSVDKDPC